MEKDKIVVGIWDNFEDGRLRAYFYTTSDKGKPRGWCASITSVLPETETMIFPIGRKMKITNFRNFAFVNHHGARGHKGMLKALLEDVKEFTGKEPMCCRLALEPQYYSRVEFDEDGIVLTQESIISNLFAEPAKEYIDAMKTWEA